MSRKEELKKKIEELKKKLELSENSCAGLQREEFESMNSDRMYLEILEGELKKLG